MIGRWLGTLLPSRRRRLQEVDAEIEAHLDLRTRELIDSGMAAPEARREAERRFGDLEAARDRLYSSAGRRDRRLKRASRFESVGADFRSGLRRIRQSPGASAIAIATFAISIGLTTATFSVIDHTLLRPLPFGEPERLVSLESVDVDGNSFPWVSADNWLDWEEQNRTLEATAVHSIFGSATIVTPDDAFTVPARYVSGRFFEVLQTPLVVGRAITAEDVRDRLPVAVVSEGFWRRVLGADMQLPLELSISGRTIEVVGVVAQGFEYPEGIEMWRPANNIERIGGAARNNINWYVTGRLAPGIDEAAARADLGNIADGIRATDPAGIYSYGVGVVPLKQQIVGDAEDTLLLAMGAVLAVLLVACANLAGLEFARRSARRHETAVRWHSAPAAGALPSKASWSRWRWQQSAASSARRCLVGHQRPAFPLRASGAACRGGIDRPAGGWLRHRPVDARRSGRFAGAVPGGSSHRASSGDVGRAWLSSRRAQLTGFDAGCRRGHPRRAPAHRRRPAGTKLLGAREPRPRLQPRRCRHRRHRSHRRALPRRPGRSPRVLARGRRNGRQHPRRHGHLGSKPGAHLHRRPRLRSHREPARCRGRRGRTG